MSFKGDDMEEKKKGIGGTFKKHTKNIAIWGGFLTFSLLVFFVLSSKDFSFFLTYAALLRTFSIVLLNYKIFSSKSVKGISIKTLQLYALVFLFRLGSILRHQGYLPYDKTGDWFYHTIEIIALLGSVTAIYAAFGPFMATYQESHDLFGNLFIPNIAGAVYALVPCILLGILVHPALNREFFSDTCWAISMYLEASAILPQIYMFQRLAGAEGGTVEVLTGHTVFGLGFSRLFELIFWIASFKELSDHGGSKLPGYFILFSQVLHLAFMADFFYYYFQSLRKGVPILLPTTRAHADNV